LCGHAQQERKKKQRKLVGVQNNVVYEGQNFGESAMGKNLTSFYVGVYDEVTQRPGAFAHFLAWNTNIDIRS
jgi:hypothetical protein